MAEFGRVYIWFVVIVAALAGIPRLLLSRRFAELQRTKLQQKNALVRSRNMSLILAFVAIVFAGLYFTPLGHRVWFKVAVIFSLLSAVEFFLQTKFNSVEALVFQNRLLGILYLGLSIGSYIMLSRS